MCEENPTEPEGSADQDRYFVVDHANKRGDRERPNPNGSLILRLRTEMFDSIVRPDTSRADEDPVKDEAGS